MDKFINIYTEQTNRKRQIAVLSSRALRLLVIDKFKEPNFDPRSLPANELVFEIHYFLASEPSDEDPRAAIHFFQLLEPSEWKKVYKPQIIFDCATNIQQEMGLGLSVDIYSGNAATEELNELYEVSIFEFTEITHDRIIIKNQSTQVAFEVFNCGSRPEYYVKQLREEDAAFTIYTIDANRNPIAHYLFVLKEPYSICENFVDRINPEIFVGHYLNKYENALTFFNIDFANTFTKRLFSSTIISEEKP